MDNTNGGTRKQKGDLAELMVACDLRRRGCKVAVPYGEECDYDLVIDRNGALERVQVKYTESGGAFVTVRCCSHSLTNGRIPASELGDGRKELRLRVAPAKNNQRAGIRLAADYTDLS